MQNSPITAGIVILIMSGCVATLTQPTETQAIPTQQRPATTTINSPTLSPSDTPDPIEDALNGRFFRKIAQLDLSSDEMIQAMGGKQTFSEGDLYSALSPDGQLLATASFTHYYVWNSQKNSLTAVFDEPGGFHGGFSAWSPSGRKLAIASHITGQISVWDSSSLSTTATIQTHYHPCGLEWLTETRLALILTNVRSPANIVVCPIDSHYPNFLAILDIGSGRFVHLEQRPYNALSIERSPDGRYLVMEERSGYDTQLNVYRQVIWDTQTYRDVLIIRAGHYGAHWLADSRHVSVISAGLLRIIDIHTSQEQEVILPQDSGVYGPYMPVNNRFVELDYVSRKIKWFDKTGIVAVGDMPFWRAETLPMVTTSGKVLVVMRPYLGRSDFFELIELIAP